MSDQRHEKDVGRSWLAGVIVMVAVVVAYIGFSRVSVGWTLAAASLIVVALIAFLWSVGARKQRGRSGRR